MKLKVIIIDKWSGLGWEAKSSTKGESRLIKADDSGIKHIAFLDSVRGLAAMAVLSEHFVIAFGLPCTGELCAQLLDNSPLHIWWDGSAAVSMFFVLSGLVLSLRHFRSATDPNLVHFHLGVFFVNRILRIWPPYCLVLLLSAVLYSLLVTNPLPSNALLPPSEWISGLWHQHPLDWRAMWREAFLLDLPPLIVLIPQAWTLSFELALSLLLPLGVLVAHRSSMWLALYCVLLVVFLDAPIFLLHFLFGLLLAQHYGAVVRLVALNPLRQSAMLLLGVLLYTVGDSLPGRLSEPLSWVGSGLGSMILLMVVIGSRRLQAWLSWAVLRHIGKISYSLYLLHMAVLIGLTPILLQFLAQYLNTRLSLWWVGWCFSLTISLTLAHVAYRFLEIPFMALGKDVSQWYCTRRSLIRVSNKKIVNR